MSAQMLDLLQNRVLKSQVRVKTAKAGGSGTIVYSRPSAEGAISTYALTCQHVIESAIAIKEEWDPRVGRKRRKEYRQLVTVEFFDWENVPHGHRPLNYSADAEIVAYDGSHDMALLKLRTVKEAPAVATLMPPGEDSRLRIGSSVIAVGAALLHDPILTQGMLTHMGDEIDYKLYWMSNAAIVFGNSGGAVFTPVEGDYHFIGIPSRVDIVGWGTPVSHLGYFSPISRVLQFLDEQLYHFIIPGHSHTEADCEQERKERQDHEDRRLTMEAPEQSSSG